MRHLSLFAGADGLGLGINSVFGSTTVGYAEVDESACAVLSARLPGVPNVGSVLEADWSRWRGTDIVSGGSPCQDLSSAGRRSGMREGTRSNLWVAMREAIAVIQPKLVIWENVRGAYSAEAHSDLERCPRCVGEHPGQPDLRALGRVLGDLSDLGFDARWYGLRASDAGAAHHRFRVFVFAWPRERPDVLNEILEWYVGAAPVPPASDAQVFPTPAVNDMGEGKTIEWWDNWTQAMKDRHGNGNGHGPSLAIEA